VISYLYSLREDARSWCRGKPWYLYLPLALYMGYVLIRHLSDREYSSILAPLNLGIHELGHLIFGFLGRFPGVLGGTLLEIIVPLLAVFNFRKLGDYFAIALSFGWLSTALFDVSRYIGDARSMELPLVTPFGGESVIHDWNYILAEMDLLPYDALLSGGVKVSAVLAMLACLAACGWLLLNMIAPKGQDFS
jgi:uncharacterized membrane protein YgdD (TMEM256/DUF423 family)